MSVQNPIQIFQPGSGINLAAATLLASASTTSTTLVSTGFGTAVIGKSTNRFLLLASLYGNHSVADTGVEFDIYRTTGAIPANGSAFVGTQIAVGAIISPTASGNVPITLIGLDNTVAPSATLNYYVAYKALAAGTAILSAFGVASSIFVVEI